VPGYDDLSRSVSDVGGFHFYGAWDPLRDEKGNIHPDTYVRLREGIERFFITDINNPAAGSTAASTLVTMLDSWAATNWSPFVGVDVSSLTLAFNHIPGGCNVLYSDGHVEFKKYADEHPVLKGGSGTTGVLQKYWLGQAGGLG
jgi:prepilin-type processing-associated H-X9-DG protein